MKKTSLMLASALSACLLPFSGQANEQAVAETFASLLKDHDKVIASQADVTAAKERYEETYGAYYPNLDLTMSYGHEDYNKPEADNTSLMARRATAKVTQLITDFGKTEAQIKQARLQIKQAELASQVAEQDLLLEAITAYLGLVRAGEAYKYAEESEANYNRQYNAEELRRDKGNGFLTDSLQAEAQLNGAFARKVRAQGAMHTAGNRYRTVFRAEPTSYVNLPKLTPPLQELPQNVEEAVDMGLDKNLQLRLAKMTEELAREGLSQTRSDKYYPKIEAIGDISYKNDYAGTAGGKREASAIVEMTYPFNLGLTAFNSVYASKADLKAATLRYSDARYSIDEQIRNSWDNYQVAVQTAKYLTKQAELSKKFLDRARKERKLGKRSLIDVLSGETSWINAQSDASSAQVDVAIAGFTLLSQLGTLNIDTINQAFQQVQ